MPYAEPVIPEHGVNQLLVFKDEVSPVSRNVVPGGKKVRCDIIGSTYDSIWAALYTRLPPAEAQNLAAAPQFRATVDAVAI
jgi:hypothetical protein